jgi:uncharacterized membrane protein YhaH (DUF805 family)
MNWFIECFKKYAVFRGRSGRTEYWHFFLVYLLVLIVTSVLDVIAGTYSSARQVGLLSGIFSLVALLPSLGVSVRRLHDTGRSGWWLLIGFIPILGVIVLLVFAAIRGDGETNSYGAVPPEHA